MPDITEPDADETVTAGAIGHVAHTRRLAKLANQAKSAINGRLSESELQNTYVEAFAPNIRTVMGTIIATDPAFAGGMSPSKTAAENTAAWDAAMAAALATEHKNVFVPAGTYTVLELTKPANVNVEGIAQREATAIPTSGTVLYRADRAGTGWVLWAEKGIVRNLALRGAGQSAGVNPAHDGLFAASQCRVENVLITRCFHGVNGNASSRGRRGSGQFMNVVVQNNHSHGFSSIRDATLIQCQANANTGHGLYLDSGANDNQWVGGRIDWNDKAGVCFFQSSENRISDIVIDRNGEQGILGSQGNRNRVDATCTRNGRLAIADETKDTHLTTSADTGCVYILQTGSGAGDTGEGYLSPKFSVRHAGGTAVQVFGSDLRGCTSSTPIVQASAGDVQIFGNVGLPARVQSMDGHRARWAYAAPVTIAPSGVGSIALPMPALASGVNTEVEEFTLTLKARGSSGGRYTASIPLGYFRNSGDATIALGALANRIGTRFALTGGTYLNVAITVDATGTTLTVALTNADAATTYYVSAILSVA